MSGKAGIPAGEGKFLTVHIGMNKTGSTSLQQFLYANRDVLLARGVLYPCREEMMFQNAHHRLAGSLIPVVNWDALLEASAGGDNPEDMVSALAREIKAFPACSQVVISSELFAMNNPEKAVSYLGRLPGISGIRVVVYLRNYVDFSESLLAHGITCQGFDTELVTEGFIRDFCRRQKNHFKRVIDAWARAVGRENVEVRVLEREQLRGGDILSDFLSLLDLERDDEFREIGARNVSLKRNGLEYMMVLNGLQKQGLVNKAEFRVIRWLLGMVPDPERCSLLGSSLREDITRWSKEECAGLAREYLGREDGVLFLNAKGKEIPGGETYGGLDPEFAVKAGHIISSRALEQGSFPRIKLSAEGLKSPTGNSAGVTGKVGRFPGIAAIHRFFKSRNSG